jgi:PAS domain-containing protein
MVSLSDGFCRLTEYPREQLVGRNCRFLQGPATDPEAVQLLRGEFAVRVSLGSMLIGCIDAIKDGHEHCSMLMNYTRSGKAFWNR